MALVLAASQVGINARMFVMSPGHERLIVIDPEILSQSQHMDRTIEGCLSF